MEVASQFAIVVLFLASAVIALWLFSTRRRRLFKGGDVAHLFEAVEVSMAVRAKHLSVFNIITFSPKASPTQRRSSPAGQLHEARLTRHVFTHASAFMWPRRVPLPAAAVGGACVDIAPARAVATRVRVCVVGNESDAM